MRVFIREHSTGVSIAISKKDLPPMETMIDNIAAIYSSASEQDRSAVNWYSEAKQFAHELAVKYAVGVDTVVRLIAVLSPLQKWESNKKFAEIALREHAVTGVVPRNCHMLTANVAKAQGLLDGNGAKLGPKTEAFYRNILGCQDSVTVDSVAASIAIGWYDMPGGYKMSQACFDTIAQAYHLAASQVQLTASELQAITWVIARRSKRANNGKGRSLIGKTSIVQ
jgi:hypothetical protein